MSNKCKITTSVFLIFCTMLLPFLVSCSRGPSVPFPEIDFTVEDIFTGNEIHLSDYRGRPVLIYFFASW